MKELVIFGKSGTASEITELISMYFNDIFDDVNVIYFDEDFVEKNGMKSKVNNPAFEMYYVLAVADVKIRRHCVTFVEKFSNFFPYTIINPTAFVAKSAKIGKGVYIGGNASVSSNVTLKDYTLVSFNASVGHDSILDEHVIALAGARISGTVTIGQGTLIGSNAFILQGLTIGEENMIDAMTYIHKDLPPRMLSVARNTKTIKRVV